MGLSWAGAALGQGVGWLVGLKLGGVDKLGLAGMGSTAWGETWVVVLVCLAGSIGCVLLTALTPNGAACVRPAGTCVAPAAVHTGFWAGSHCSAPFQCLLLPRQRRRADAAGAFPPRRPHRLRHPPPRAAAAHPDPRRGGLCCHHQQLHATRLHRGQGLCQGVGRGAAGHQDGRGSAGLPGEEEEEEQKGLRGGAGKGKVPLFQWRGQRGLSRVQ